MKTENSDLTVEAKASCAIYTGESHLEAAGRELRAVMEMIGLDGFALRMRIKDSVDGRSTAIVNLPLKELLELITTGARSLKFLWEPQKDSMVHLISANMVDPASLSPASPLDGGSQTKMRSAFIQRSVEKFEREFASLEALRDAADTLARELDSAVTRYDKSRSRLRI